LASSGKGFGGEEKYCRADSHNGGGDADEDIQGIGREAIGVGGLKITAIL
jgi:hypothetical protein